MRRASSWDILSLKNSRRNLEGNKKAEEERNLYLLYIVKQQVLCWMWLLVLGLCFTDWSWKFQSVRVKCFVVSVSCKVDRSAEFPSWIFIIWNFGFAFFLLGGWQPVDFCFRVDSVSCAAGWFTCVRRPLWVGQTLTLSARYFAHVFPSKTFNKSLSINILIILILRILTEPQQ